MLLDIKQCSKKKLTYIKHKFRLYTYVFLYVFKFFFYILLINIYNVLLKTIS
jgi:hypothetical protein